MDTAEAPGKTYKSYSQEKYICNFNKIMEERGLYRLHLAYKSEEMLAMQRSKDYKKEEAC